MRTLEVYSLHGISICHSTSIACREIFNPITYRFEIGRVYCITTKNYNSLAPWALACALGGSMEGDYQGKIVIDGVPNNQHTLRNEACFVADARALLPKYDIINQFNIYNYDYSKFLVNCHDDDHFASAKDLIEHALSKSKSTLSIEGIKEKFRLSEERLTRDLRFVSGEIWLISMAIGYAEGRTVFIFPLIDSKNAIIINGFDSLIEDLKQEGKMVIIPVMNIRDIHIRYDDIVYTGIGNS